MILSPRGVAAKAARKGVRVNALCPGPVTETHLSKDLGGAIAEGLGVSPEKQLADFLKRILTSQGLRRCYPLEPKRSRRLSNIENKILVSTGITA